MTPLALAHGSQRASIGRTLERVLGILAAYRNVARDPRFRALERRETHEGLRLGAALAVLTAILHLTVLAALVPAALATLAVVHGAEILVALIALALPAVWLGTGRRRSPSVSP